MFQTYNRDEIYFLMDLNKNTVEKIGDKNDLIKRVANIVAYQGDFQYGKKHNNWNAKQYKNQLFQNWEKTRNIFTLQNLTGNDSYFTWISVNEYTRCFYPYVFYTANQAVFDIRLIMDEVSQCLLNHGYIYAHEYGYYYRQRPRRRTAYSRRSSFKLREQKTRITCEEQGVKYRKQALPFDGEDPWDDFAPSRRSTGWKDKKDQKQWQHNIRNKKRGPLPMGKPYFKNDTLVQELELIKSIEVEDLVLQTA